MRRPYYTERDAIGDVTAPRPLPTSTEHYPWRPIWPAVRGTGCLGRGRRGQASIYLARMAWTSRGRFGGIDRCDGWVTWFFRITRQLVHMMIETQFIPD